MKKFLQEIMKKNIYLKHQTLGRWVIHPSDPANQRIILKIVWFLWFMFNLEFKSWMDSNAGVRVGCSFIFSWFGVTLGHLFTSAPWCKTFLTLIFAMHYIYKKNQILNDLQKNASHQMHEIFHSKIRFISGTRKPLWFFPF